MKREFEFKPSPRELAEEFAEWNSEDQASFFEHVYRRFNAWGAYKRSMQVLGIGKAIGMHWPEAAEMVRELAADTEWDALAPGKAEEPIE